jgi:hypothetical protein
MPTYHFENISQLTVKPLGSDQGLGISLTFQSTGHRRDTVLFKLSPKEAMSFLQLLKEVQQKFGWAVPEFSLDVSGRPSLRVVVDNSETDRDDE